MLTVGQNLQEFIADERGCFSNRDNNLFAFSLGQVERYYRILGVVLTRYVSAGIHWWEMLREWNTRAEVRTTTLLDDDDMELWRRLDQAVLEAQLEVECFYLLAKIMLDRIAHFLEFYFGRAKGLSLDSHDDLSRRFKSYCLTKGLVADERLLKMIADLRKRVSDFRDYHISHEKSGRTIRGIGRSSSGHVIMPMARIYARRSDKPVESEDLVTLSVPIDEYILGVLDFLRRNRSRCKLN